MTSFFRQGGGGGGGGGFKIPTVGADDPGTPSVASQTLLNRRINLLTNELPGLAQQPEILVQLASQNLTDDEMIQSALAGIGFSEVNRVAAEMASWDDNHKRAEWAITSEPKRRALLAAGFEPAPE
ncbi:MAG: hypothetical protein ACRCW4_00255, partial [Candidatus Neomicrothrix subdominans]